MTELVRVYVGSDERGGRGEAIIKYGLRKIRELSRPNDRDGAQYVRSALLGRKLE